MSKGQRFEQLSEIQIAEIREIFTLFDKNSDGYVNTNELGTIIRALGQNPSNADIKDMEKDVDPNDTGSFDQMNLISLIARRPKQQESLEDMKSAISILAASSSGVGEEKDQVKISVESLSNYMQTMGEKMSEVEVEEVLADCVDLQHDDNMIIDDFANYLMSR